MIFIFVMSAFPAEQSDEQSGLIVNTIRSLFPSATDVKLITTIVRKTAHFIEYAILGFLFTRAIYKTSKTETKKGLYYGIALSLITSVGDETHQAFVPGRSCEFRDICIDTIGASLGALIYYLVIVLRKRAMSKQI